MIPELYLLRHGETEWNVQGRLQGRLDSPLTERGQEQARRQAELLAALPPMAAWASPAGRAVATARIALAGRPFRQDWRLVEIDLGPQNGATLADLRQAHPQAFTAGGIGWYDRLPGAEGFAALRARVAAFLAELDQPAVIVTHGITLHMIRLAAMDLPLAALGRLPVVQGALHHVHQGRHQVIS